MVSLCSRVSALQSSPRDPKGAYFLVSSLVDLARASIAVLGARSTQQIVQSRRQQREN
jgi:hypothetical protein